MKILIKLFILISLYNCKTMISDVIITEPSLSPISQITNQNQPLMIVPKMGSELQVESESQEFLAGIQLKGPAESVLDGLNSSYDNLTKSIIQKINKKTKSDSFYVTYVTTSTDKFLLSKTVTKTVRGYPIYFEFKESPATKKVGSSEDGDNKNIIVSENYTPSKGYDGVCNIPLAGIYVNMFTLGIACKPAIERNGGRMTPCEIPFFGILPHAVSLSLACTNNFRQKP